MTSGTIGINPSEPTINLNLYIKEARLFVAALNLAADYLDSTIPNVARDGDWDSLSEDIRSRLTAITMLTGCAVLIQVDVDNFDESIPHN